MLGGGLVAGGVILLGGDPGIGKSTLLLQAMAAIGASRRALYVTGEESADQIALRAQRLGLVNAAVELLAEVQLEAIVGAIRTQRPEVVVIDSIQTVYTEALESAPGSVAQVRECAAQLTRLAKQSAITVILVGHVTKEGAIAGPRVLEHIVDTVLLQGDTRRLPPGAGDREASARPASWSVFAMTGSLRVAPTRRRCFSLASEAVADSIWRRSKPARCSSGAGADRSRAGWARAPPRGRARSAAAGAVAAWCCAMAVPIPATSMCT